MSVRGHLGAIVRVSSTLVRWMRPAAMLMALAVLAACGSDTSLLDSGASINQQTAVTSVAPSVNTKAITRTIAYRAAIGPPDDVAAELARQLSDAAIEQGIALVVDPKYQADITLRGYVTAFRKGNAVNVTYLWDVVDSRGQRVNRIAIKGKVYY